MQNKPKSHDDWLIPGLEFSHKRAWRAVFICVIMIVGLAVAYLCTLNYIFEWIAWAPAGVALYCLGHAGAMVRADDYIEDYTSQVALILEAGMAKKMKVEMPLSKVIELMQIYLADHRQEMAPDDVMAHAQAIGALLGVQLRSGKRGIRGISKVLMSARRVKNMLVRGGDSIGCKTNES